MPFILQRITDLEPLGVFDVDNCAVEEAVKVGGVVTQERLVQDEVCVVEIVRQKGNA
jgi:hypothetical protein